MKKMVLVSAMNGFMCCFATAQTMPPGAVNSPVKVCTPSSGKNSTSCYLTRYAENYRVCRNNNGYFICGGITGTAGNAYPSFTEPGVKPYDMPAYDLKIAPSSEGSQQTPAEMRAPQSQSYPGNTNTVVGIGKLYNGRSYVRVCNQADNVAASNRLPYQGCPSPQDDGPDKNNARNINESNPINQPPLTGRPVSR